MNLRIKTPHFFPLLAVLLAAATCPRQTAAITSLFQENFEGIPKTASPTYGFPNAWSPVPPPGWDVLNNLPPGGIPEWAGWTFWEKGLWQEVGGSPRTAFSRGRGTIAIADNDLWNGDNEPAQDGLYNTFLQTPQISLDRRRPNEDQLWLAFDTSWFARECCDDVENSSTQMFQNNQTGVVRARLPDGSTVDLLRWEAAPFRDALGRPTDEPIDLQGNANTPNPFFQPLVANERVYLDLSPFVPVLSTGSLTTGAFASSSGNEVALEFAMEGAGDDGYWAVDNVEMASFPGAMAGDLFIDGVLDEKDIDEFALGLLDEEEYTTKWFGQTPGARGSNDASFDYDDIPWFLSIMEGESAVAEPALLLARALTGVPEPSAALLLGGTLFALGASRRRAV